jgi:hypothetical protein
LLWRMFGALAPEVIPLSVEGCMKNQHWSC